MSAEAVARTALVVAAIRARESAQEQPLFHDPFAARLAGPAGRDALAGMVAQAGEQSTVQIVVRTRFWDQALLRAAQSAHQVVLLAAGMDARAFRLPWPSETTVFEVDQPAVIAAKNAALSGEQPRCTRVALGADLAEGDWPAALTASGLNPRQPSAWLIEGLLQYLDEPAVRTLLRRVDALSAPGSVLLFDVVSRALLTSPVLAEVLEAMAAAGSPWLFGSDDPGGLVEPLGWSAAVTDMTEPGIAYGRWQTGDAPVGGGYFVEAHARREEPKAQL